MRILGLVLLVACEQEVGKRNNDVDDGVQEGDVDAPLIEHAPDEGPYTFGSDVSVQATIIDEESGVLFATLYYWVEGGSAVDKMDTAMLANGDVYTGTIDGEDQEGAGMWYYIEAVDKSGNTAVWPDLGSEDPQHIRLTE